MAVSILHRATGVALSLGGGLIFIWWLMAAAGGPAAYATFERLVLDAPAGDSVAGIVNILARIVAVGLTWAFFQHMFSGIRHLFLDIGAGYELKTNKRVAMLTMIGSAIVTLGLWAAVFAR
jgi:succinate dehydrogenase / fumarate reductase, cytochrome b subunit